MTEVIRMEQPSGPSSGLGQARRLIGERHLEQLSILEIDDPPTDEPMIPIDFGLKLLIKWSEANKSTIDQAVKNSPSSSTYEVSVDCKSLMMFQEYLVVHLGKSQIR